MAIPIMLMGGVGATVRGLNPPSHSSGTYIEYTNVALDKSKAIILRLIHLKRHIVTLKSRLNQKYINDIF